ncbi:hypothetical protein F2Q70_00001617 [Brassica cretica]|uniref:Uncharacterized protein n=1 Tax=Brassica cretica TaxID=69181 RepID=A0A8S9IPY3_BRACR|nr:hypothetical protein F2Q70_00001617 [Brassica cretica]
MSIDCGSTESIDNSDSMSIDNTNIFSEESNSKTLIFDIKVNVAHNKLCPDHDSTVKGSPCRECSAGLFYDYVRGCSMGLAPFFPGTRLHVSGRPNG